MDIKNKITEMVKKIDFWIVIALFAVSLGVYFSQSEHCLWVDEARDLIMTQNLLKTGQIEFGGEQEIYHPYMFYLTLAFISIFFGGVSQLSGVVTVALFGALSVSATYLLGKEAFNRKVGIFAAAMFLVLPLQMFMSARILYHTTLCFFVVIALYFIIKWMRTNSKIDFAAGIVLLGLAFSTQYTAFGILVAVGLLLLATSKELKEKKDVLITTTGVFLISIFPLVIMHIINFLKDSARYFEVLDAVFINAAPDQAIFLNPWYYYITNIPSFVGNWVFLFFIFGLFSAFLLISKRKTLFVIMAAIFGAVLIPSFVQFKDARFVLHALPFIFIIAAVGIDKIYRELEKRNIYLSKIVVIVLLLLILIPAYNDGTNFTKQKASGYCGIKDAAVWIDQNTELNGKVFAGSYMQLSLHSNKYSENDVLIMPRTLDEFKQYELNGSVDFVEVDVWEFTQPEYAFSYFTNNSNYTPVFGWPNNQKANVILFKYNN
jgi:4-amino-4-deoxy-L-arabinose transferase-like glycosyltransferase